MNALIVDDSIVFRTALKVAISEIKEFNEFTTASNGKIALDYIKSKHFDLVIMDLEMPEMDGTSAIKAIREFNKTIPIIIFSAVSQEGANKTLKALEIGANDFVQKVQGGSNPQESIDKIKQDLVPKIKALCFKEQNTNQKNNSISSIPSKDAVLNVSKYENFRPSLILIGSSTGGPDALNRLFSKLKGKLTIPLLIIQHMPPIFTTQLASMLTRQSKINVNEAKDGQEIIAGECYLAPGDFHMTVVERDGKKFIKLNQNEKMCYVRPAVDATFFSVAENIKGSFLAIILTGMGEDGKAGILKLKSKSITKVIIQDKESSVVWGMPGAVFDHKLQDDIGTIEQIAQVLNGYC